MSENAVFDLLWAVQGRRSVLIVLQERFGSIPREIAERLEIIEDVAKLEALVRSAAVAPTLEAFRDKLEDAGPGPGAS